jgi:1-acyl-sn-glycerol-3-phosphate acyltransferase
VTGANLEYAHERRSGTQRGRLRGWGRAAVGIALDLVAFKPIAVFVGWLSGCANRIRFERRRELRERIDAALAGGRPVLVASNHVSWFDDPVIPMALRRTGLRATLELGGLAAWLVLCAAAPADAVGPATRALGAGIGALAVARFGVRKSWWTLGALENLSDASVLRGKLALTRSTPPGRFLRGVLALADPAIRGFMRSDTVKTILVDRRPGEDAKLGRERALQRTFDIAARPACVWVFFEGGRSKVPGEIAPARRGVGALVLGLRQRGHDPLLIALSHRGMERVIPPGAPRFLSTGHTVTVRWAELGPEIRDAAASGEQAVADAVRAAVVRLQVAAPAETPRTPRMRKVSGEISRVAGTCVGWLAFGLLVLVWGLLVVPATLLLAPVWPGVRERFARLTAATLGGFVRALPFLRFRVEGDAGRLRGARILVANHQSRLDSPLLIAIERRLAGPVRGYMLRVPVVGAVIRLLGFFDADAGEAASVEALNRAAQRARIRGEGLLFYPEGTRSRDGEIGAFQRGTFRAAFDHDLPIQPVVIEGIEAVFPPGHAVAQADRSHVVRVRYLEPLHPPYGEGPRRDVVRALAERVRRSMAEELARLRAERARERDSATP